MITQFEDAVATSVVQKVREETLEERVRRAYVDHERRWSTRSEWDIRREMDAALARRARKS